MASSSSPPDDNNNDDNAEIWIYHERQEALLCGQHTLNNLLQACVFTTSSLSEIAQQLDELELTYMAANNEGGIQSKEYLKRVAEGSGNVDPWGNFSIQVLRSALEHRYQISLPNVQQEGVLTKENDITQMDGFVCNRESHWYAIRKVHGRFWDLNSTNEHPLPISHFKVATHMNDLLQQGYSVFCVVQSSLPDLQQNRSLHSHAWWKESDLLQTTGKKRKKLQSSLSNNTSSTSWKNVGSGIRLDGKSTTNDVINLVEEEDEQLQMAMAASMEPMILPSNGKTGEDKQTPILPPEPQEGLEGVVKIQFRYANKRIVRRFYKTDLVSSLYQFCQQESSSTVTELRYGFPPKNLAPMKDQTIQEAQLAGESIQVR